jgi:protocatechuate 3,4-dioxygenase beta subunit
MVSRARVSRRDFLKVSAGVSAAVAVGASSWAAAQTAPLRPTPACPAGARRTPPQTEGPYFTPGSPERASLLERGMRGARIVLTGTVLSTACAPVARAMVDVWHADAEGAYDTRGYRLRGHQFTDEHGRYRVETIVPGVYPGRTRHVHVKVRPPGRRELTTQLYFPDEPANRRDGIYSSALVMRVRDQGPEGALATFDFVLDV